MNYRSIVLTSHLPARRCPAGTSLVECVLIIAVGSVLTGIVVSGLAAMMRYDNHQNANMMNREQLQSLLTMLREDARQSTAYELDVENQSLQFLQSRNRTVEYRFHGGECDRTTISQSSAKQTMRLRTPVGMRLSSIDPQGKKEELLRMQFETRSSATTQENNPPLPKWQLELVARMSQNQMIPSPLVLQTDSLDE